MVTTSARLLALLSLLQLRREWVGRELAERLDVGERTIRRDVERLRSLGYPIEAAPGVAGGYRLGAGGELPPLLLDDDEAVAVALGLRTAASGSVAGIEETSVRALAKLEQVLPTRLRRRVSALGQHTFAFAGGGPQVDPEVLASIAGACRDGVALRFSYVSRTDVTTRRHTEPHSLVHSGWRWYLVAYDLEREDWRTFRVDRIAGRLTPGGRGRRRSLPGGDAAAFVQRSIRAGNDPVQARVLLHAPHAAMAARVPARYGSLEEADGGRCLLTSTAGWSGTFAVYVALLDVEFTVLEPPELIEQVRSLAGRFARATPPPPHLSSASLPTRPPG